MRFLGNKHMPGLALEGHYDPRRNMHVAELTHGHPGTNIRRLAEIQVSKRDAFRRRLEGQPMLFDLPFCVEDMFTLEEMAGQWCAKNLVWC